MPNPSLTLPHQDIFTFYEGTDENQYDQLSGRNLNLAPLELLTNIKELDRVMQIVLTGGNPEGYIYQQSTVYTDIAITNLNTELKSYTDTEILRESLVLKQYTDNVVSGAIDALSTDVDVRIDTSSVNDRAYADGGDTETLEAAKAFALLEDINVKTQSEIYSNTGDEATYFRAKDYIDERLIPVIDTKSGINTLEICSHSSFSNTMVRTDLDELWTFGGNVGNNPKGDGTYDAQNSFRLAFPGETGKYVKAEMSGAESFVLFDSGNLWAWGHNFTGACGAGHNTPIMIPTIVETGVSNFFRPISAGLHINYSATWIIKDGYVFVSGYNEYGNMGIGDILEEDTRQINEFKKVDFFVKDTVLNIWPIGNRYANTVILLSGGQIFGAGYNGNGQLGTEDLVDKYQFTLITAAWGGHVEATEQVDFYGVNGYSSNGYLDLTGNFEEDPTNFDNKEYDYNSQSFLLCYRKSVTRDAEYRTCGNNNWGQLGSGYSYDQNGNIIETQTEDWNILEPHLIDPLLLPKEAKEISVFGGGPASIFVLGVDGDLYSWGYNKSGQLGLGLDHNVYAPTKVDLTLKVDKLFMNGYDSFNEPYRNAMFIKDENGTIQSCGFNDFGLLGNGTLESTNVFSPIHLSNDVDIVDIQCSGADQCKFIIALDSEQKVWVWGFNGRNDLFLNNKHNVVVPKQKAIQSAP